MKRNNPYAPSRNKWILPLSSVLMLLPLSQQLMAQDDTEEEILMLSPFEVDSSSDVGYMATTTLAGTRLRTNLRDTGSALQVVTEEYLKDINATSSKDLLKYTTSTEVGGIGGNFTGLGDGPSLISNASIRSPQTNTRVRGLSAADNARDFFLTDIPWDSYNTGRIDIQRGPNAILFGLGSPAGLINGDVDDADLFHESGEINLGYGSYDSQRASINYNHVILEGELAVRVAALDRKDYYRQDPCFEEDERIFGAVQWQPEFMKDLFKGVGGKTTFKANYEKGSIDANRPRPTPPIDAITPWYTALNQATYDAWTINDANGPLQTNSPNYSAWVGTAGSRVFDNPVAVFSDPNSSEVSFYTKGSMNEEGLGEIGNDLYNWVVYRGIVANSKYASDMGLLGSKVGAYKDNTLSDASIFDFYNKALEGDNKREWQDFDAYNFTLSQTFFDDSLGFEVAYDKQEYVEGQWNMMNDAWSNGITVDIMSTLIMPATDANGDLILDADGNPTPAANPNVGRPMVASDSTRNQETTRDREAFRVTAYYDLDFKKFMDSESTLAKILNRSVFTGVYSKQTTEESLYGWVGYTPANGEFYGDRNGPEPTINNSGRLLTTLCYLGDSLIGTSLGQDLGIGTVGVQKNPTTGYIWEFDNTLLGAAPSNNLSDYVGWEYHEMEIWNANLGDRDQLYTTASIAEEEIESKIFVWQGFLFEGNVVPIIGYREDSVKGRSLDTTTPSLYERSNKSINIYDPDFKYGDWLDSGTSDTLSWSLTVHAPEFITKHLPWDMKLSAFYNKSENFQPGANDVDLLGHTVPGASGETKDYGFVVSILDDRFTLKVNKYETNVKNDRLDGYIANTYMVSAADAWAYLFATKASQGIDSFYGYYDYNPTSGEVEYYDAEWTGTGPALRYDPSVIGFYDSDTMTDETTIRAALADALEYQQAAITAALDPANRPNADLIKTWNIDYEGFESGRVGWIQGQEPNNLVITGDTESKGYEFELTAQPTQNWNISLNVAKTEASRLNLAESYSVFVEERNEFFNTSPYGNVMYWGRDNREHVLQKWTAELWGNYKLYNALSGSNNPEVRKWRFNLVSNYKFNEGMLKGFNIGGAYRWEDKAAMGYPVTADGENYDISNPYYSPSQDYFDMWIGYERDITEKLHWRIQLNVKNILADDDLIPITCQPDGTPAAYRIPDDTTWYITNTFSF